MKGKTRIAVWSAAVALAVAGALLGSYVHAQGSVTNNDHKHIYTAYQWKNYTAKPPQMYIEDGQGNALIHLKWHSWGGSSAVTSKAELQSCSKQTCAYYGGTLRMQNVMRHAGHPFYQRAVFTDPTQGSLTFYYTRRDQLTGKWGKTTYWQEGCPAYGGPPCSGLLGWSAVHAAMFERPVIVIGSASGCWQANEYRSGGVVTSVTYRLRLTRDTCGEGRFRIDAAARCIIVPTPYPVTRWETGRWADRKGQLSVVRCPALGSTTAGYRTQRDWQKHFAHRGMVSYHPVWD
jgi:hypothetical protein